MCDIVLMHTNISIKGERIRCGHHFDAFHATLCSRGVEAAYQTRYRGVLPPLASVNLFQSPYPVSGRKTRNRRQQCGAPPHSPVLSCIVWARLSPGYKLRPARAGHGFTMVTRGTGRLFALFVICPLSPASCPPTDLCVHGDTTSLFSSLPTLCMTRSDAG